MVKVLFLCLLFVLLALSQNPGPYVADFSAKFFIGKPGLSGYLTGTLYYSETYKAIRYNYDPTGNYYEIYHYDTADQNDLFVYKACTGKCDIIPQDPNIKQPIFQWKSGDTCSGTPTTVKYGTCVICTSPSDTVTSYCIDLNNGNVPLRVTLKDGTQIDMTGQVKSDALATTKSNYDPVPAWGCVLNCGAVADIALIFDESGSIDDTEWTSVQAFAKTFVNGFTIAPDKINMGLAFFSTGARVQLPIISDQTAFRAAVNPLTRLNHGTTWIGYGVITTANMLLNSPRNVPKITVLMTDGYPNDVNPFPYPQNNPTKYWGNTIYSNLEWLTYFRNIPALMITIGVGTDTNPAYLQYIASTNATGGKMYFSSNTFTGLTQQSLITAITRSVCTVSGTPVQCPLCAGLCTCGTCSCPSTCDDGNPCTDDICSSTKNNQGGCIYEPKVCTDNNACTSDKCDPTGGCVFANISCDDGNPCTNDYCDPVTGCGRTTITCDDGNPCTTDKCNPQNGQCIHTNVTCNDNNPCTIDYCDKGSGSCGAKPITQTDCYNKSDPCWVKECSVVNGQCMDVTNLCQSKNPCTVGTGTPGVFVPIDCTGGSKCISRDCNVSSTNPNGCLNTPVNCDDGSVCTTDSCDPAIGCINTPIDCFKQKNDYCLNFYCNATTGCIFSPKICDDGNNCTTDSCDSKTGCVFTPKNCSDNNACTIDSCDASLGCQNKLIDVNVTCNDGTVCTIDTCDAVLGCVNTLINCTSPPVPVVAVNGTNNTASASQICRWVSSCDSVRGCLYTQKCNVTIAAKISCTKEDCDGDEKNCKQVKNNIDACAAIVAAALSAGIIAAIVVAAVVFAGAAVGGAVALNQFVFKGEFTNSSGIYVPETQTVQNPIFGDKQN